MDSIDFDEQLRKALIRINDEKICHYIAKKINNEVKVFRCDDDFIVIFEEYIMPRMAEMGALSSSYINKEIINLLKEKCIEYLDKDRLIIENNKTEILLKENKRAIWVRDSIAFWAWRLNWTDLLDKLENDNWYWSCVFNPPFDQDNTNLLVLSTFTANEYLRKQAINVMTSHPYHKLDGAIAWKRMEQLRKQRTGNGGEERDAVKGGNGVRS